MVPVDRNSGVTIDQKRYRVIHNIYIYILIVNNTLIYIYLVNYNCVNN